MARAKGSIRWMIVALYVTLCALGLAFAGSAAAQGPAGGPLPRVTDVYREEVQKVPGETPGAPAAEVVKKYRTVQLRDVLTVEVGNLAALLAEAQSKGKDVVLYLDDRPIAAAVAFPPTDPTLQRLRFPLERTEASRDAWAWILSKPGFEPRPTRVSVGLEDQFAIPADAKKATVLLTVIPTGWFLSWLALFLVFFLGFFYLAQRTDVIRDSTPLPGDGARRPYSLARTQAAWWFFLILASYMFIGLITGDFNTSITSTVLILMGISSGTVVGSAFVDASKTNPESAKRQAVAIQTLTAEVQQLGAGAADLEDKLSQLRKMRNESEHFLQDILSDANGVSFHRFQMLAWTVVLGIIFVTQVWKSLAMPEFNDTLLSLMGISAGTYIGLKIPEDSAKG